VCGESKLNGLEVEMRIAFFFQKLFFLQNKMLIQTRFALLIKTKIMIEKFLVILAHQFIAVCTALCKKKKRRNR
jgi:hypothetical protein